MATGDPALSPVGDPEVLAALHQACFPEDSWSAEAIAALASGPGVFALSAAAGAPAGAPAARGFVMARCIAEECEILTLCVHPGQRRRGLGRALLLAAMARARALGAEKVLLEAAEDNRAARALYGSLGFVELSRRPAYYQRANRGREAAVVLAFSFASG